MFARAAISPRINNGNRKMEQLKESDWKRFRKMVPDLRERYLKVKNRELVAILMASDKTPTDQFWDTFEAMKKEQKVLVDCLDDHRRSTMLMSMALMCRYGMLNADDLKEFSEGLQGEMSRYLR